MFFWSYCNNVAFARVLLYLKEMTHVPMLKIFLIFAFFLSSIVEASFYAIEDKMTYDYKQLLSNFDLVVLTSKDCAPCKQLMINLENCAFPPGFKVAWVGSQTNRYKPQTGSISKIKSSEKTIQKLTSITPKSFLIGKPFREGLFGCNELKTEISNDPSARAGNL
jgi:hypothetical protein